MNFTLSDIQGQETAITYLKSYARKPDLTPPLLILHGPPGTGKWSAAERFVKGILCLEGNSCGRCSSCISFMSSQHPDYIEFPSEKSIPIGDEKNPEEFSIRWLQRSRLNYKPHLSSYRVILIPDASRINNEAETALLKSLEDISNYNKFIFLTENLKDLKQTIISRASCIPFQYLPTNVLKQINESQDRETLLFYGGSINPFQISDEQLYLIKDTIEPLLSDSIQLLKLENIIKDSKETSSGMKDGINQKMFLEIICVILMHYYTKEDYEKNIPKIECIFEFLEFLKLEIPGTETFLVSKLFFQLNNLTH